jgi:FAD/FMN-containing dehydrogenase
VPDDATALSGRSARWLYHCYGIWADDDNDRHIGWVRAAQQAMKPWTMNGMALNFMNDIDNARVQTTFGAAKYRRLVALKDAYDPANVFRMNQNVPPSNAYQDTGHSS